MAWTHGRKWTDEMIESSIRHVMDELKLDTFPTSVQIEGVYHDKGLTNKLSKSGGYRYWAEKMGIPMGVSTSGFGKKFEEIAVDDIFEHTGLTSRFTSSRYPYDLYVADCIKVDVKVSKRYFRFSDSKSWAYTFNLEKEKPTCDIFVLYGVKGSMEIDKTMIIPAVFLSGQTQVGVGENSKWDAFMNRWDYFTDYKSFIDGIKKSVQF